MKKGFVVFAFLAVIGLVVFGLYQRQLALRQAASNSNNWRIVTVERGIIEATVNATGVIQPRRQLALTFKSAGRVQSIAAQEGQAVRQGDLLAQLETDELDLQIRQAQVALEIAEERAKLTRRGAKREDVAAAEAALRAAQASLARLKEGPSPSQLAAAQAALRAAQASLARLKEGPSPSQLAAAQAALRAAQANVQRLRDGPSESQLAAAEASLKAAQASYDQLRASPSAEDLRRAKLAVDQAKNSLWGAQNARDSLGLSVQFGGPRSQYDQAEAQVLNAEIAVELAEMNYRQLQEGPSERELLAAQASLEQAWDAYETLKAMPRETDLAAAESQLAQAQATLDQLMSGPSEAELAAAEAQIAQAQATLDQLTSGPSEAELATVEAQIAQAEATLAKLRAGASEEEIAIAEAQVEQARLSLEQAKLLRQGSAITAPFNGVIASVNVEEGALVSAATPVLVLVDISAFRIEVQVDEMDIALVAEGQPVLLTLDALPSEKIEGRVARIAPLASVEGGIVSYAVEIAVAPTDAPLRAGMSATAEITTQRKENVLLVPNRAIRVDRENGTYHVEKWINGQIHKAEIVPGLRNESVSEVVRGVEAGEALVIRQQTLQERISSRLGF